MSENKEARFIDIEELGNIQARWDTKTNGLEIRLKIKIKKKDMTPKSKPHYFVKTLWNKTPDKRMINNTFCTVYSEFHFPTWTIMEFIQTLADDFEDMKNHITTQ